MSLLQKHLWSFQDFDKSVTMPLSLGQSKTPNIGPAPMMMAEYTNDDAFEIISRGFDKRSYTVDVIKDFPWTASPRNAESVADVPQMQLRELNVEYNPLINQIAQNATIATSEIKRGLGGAYSIVMNAAKGVSFDKYLKDRAEQQNGNKPKQKKSVSEKIDDFFGKISTSVDEFVENVNLKPSRANISITDKDYDPMAPYHNLYSTSPTGWRYIMPYFDRVFRNLTSSWGANTEQGFLGSFAGNVNALAEVFSGLNNTFEPGMFIENPTPYNFGADKKTFTVTFPLLNTMSYEDVTRNWQLIFLLTYQNLPNKVSKSLSLPPVIYEALLPGVWYSKYAYISSMRVDFVGATRKMNLIIPSVTKNIVEEYMVGQTEIDTIIPDAYNITLTITELFSESQNQAYTALEKRYLNSKVKTGVLEDQSPEKSALQEAVDTAGGAFNKARDAAGRVIDKINDIF